jgi:hypothetical protein
LTDRPSDPFNADEFAALVSLYLNGTPTPRQLQLLNRQLAESKPARLAFVRMTRLHGLLTERATSRSDEMLGDESDPTDGDSAGSSMNETVVVPAIRDAFDYEESRQPVDMPDLSHLSYRPPAGRPAQRWWIVAAISGLAAVLVIGFFLTLRPTPKPAPPVAVVPAAGPTSMPTANAVQPVVPTVPSISPETRPSSIVAVAVSVRAKIVASVAATWGDPALKLLPNDLVPTGPVELTAGWARIEFPNGTSVVIEAPAKFEVSLDGQVLLTTGRIAAEVPPAGHGFTVVAPLCRVVDRGTDFGMFVDSAGRNELSVYKGSVDFNHGTAVPVTVREGSGRRIDSATAAVVETRTEPAAYVRKDQFDRWAAAAKSPDQVSPTERWRNYTEQLSRDPSLKLLYTFDGRPTDGNVLHNRAASTAGNFDLGPSDHDPNWTDGRLPGLAALDFHPDQAQRLLLPTYPVSQTGSMTVATWVYARTAAPWAGIVKNWGDSKCGELHLGLTGSSEDLEIELDGATPGGPVCREGDGKTFPTGRWVLVAFVTDGKKVDLYRDGQLVATAPSRPLPSNPEIKSLAFGFKTGDDGVSPLANAAVGYWDGMIGDFAMFDRALSPAEMSRMYDAGKP